jgi:hypothetical protein
MGEERSRQAAGEYTHAPCQDCYEWQRFPVKLGGPVAVGKGVVRQVLKAGTRLRQVLQV